jgi:hypothetical protein
MEPVVTETSGSSWVSVTPPLPSPGSKGGALTSVTCPSTAWCQFGGYYYDTAGNTQAWLLTQSGGSFTSVPAPVPADGAPSPAENIGQISCPAVGSCVAVGSYLDSANLEEVAVLTLSNGNWTAVAPAYPPASSRAPTVSGLSCPSIGWCAFDGTDYGDGSYPQLFLETLSNGTLSGTNAPLPADAPAGSVIFSTSDISCGAPGSCVALGSYMYSATPASQVTSIDVEALTLSAGSWTATTAPSEPNAQESLPGPIHCASVGVCTAIGNYGPSNVISDGMVLTLSDGAWTELSQGNTYLNDLSCPLSQWCAAGGTSGSDPVVVALQYGGAPTTVAVTSSSNPGVVGSPVTYTASVQPTPDGGSVTFYSFRYPIEGCGAQPVDPATGRATCTITYTDVANGPGSGPLDVTASYFGDANFSESGPSPVLEQTIVPPPTPPPSYPPPTFTGYWEVGSDGSVFAFGDSSALGSLSGMPLNKPIVGIAADPATGGYWLVASDGGIFSFNAPFYGSTGAIHLNKPIVGIAATGDGRGYWLVASDGGIFSFGDALFHGSMGGQPLNRPIVGMSEDPFTGGYWLVASDGGIFSFDASFQGSTGSISLNKPIVGMSPDPHTGGYRLVASDGGIFSYNAPFEGSTGALTLNSPIVGMATDPSTGGYWLVAGDGGIFSFNAPFEGSAGSLRLPSPIVGMSAL